MICGNCVVNQLIVAGNALIKRWTLIQEFTSAVKKFSFEKLILVFHNLVLKHPEECKTLCKIAAALRPNPKDKFVENYFCKLSARSSNNL